MFTKQYIIEFKMLVITMCRGYLKLSFIGCKLMLTPRRQIGIVKLRNNKF